MSLWDRILTVWWFIFLVVGLIGVIAPVLPGSILSFLWLMLIHRTASYHISLTRIIIFAALVVIANIIDYYLPLRGTKKYGGTKAWVAWSTAGLIAGLFVFPPFWMIFGPFVGAFLGEYLAARNRKQAFRSAWGAFVGFLLTTGIKLVLGWRMLIYAIQLVR